VCGAGSRWQEFRVFISTEPFRSSTTVASLGSVLVSSIAAVPALTQVTAWSFDAMQTEDMWALP
jgi:hypothetical protein